ncbi:MAG: GNAT family N-acetyltransferase [Myxococcota bacterium]
MGHRDDQYWAEFFGMAPEDWSSRGVSFRPHVRLAGFRGLWCFRRAQRVVVSAPPAWVSTLRQRWGRWDLDRLLDPSALQDSLGDDCERCIGPAFQGCLEVEPRPEPPSPHVRPVTAADRAAIENFERRCGAEAWSTSSLQDATAFAHVYADGPTITAMGGLRGKGEGVGDLCVLTDPHHRGQGRATAALSAVTRAAVEHGTHVLYQTLEANVAAVRLAFALGFTRYANHVAVRLRRDRPGDTA